MLGWRRRGLTAADGAATDAGREPIPRELLVAAAHSSLPKVIPNELLSIQAEYRNLCTLQAHLLLALQHLFDLLQKYATSDRNQAIREHIVVHGLRNMSV